jgi:hypothetical protein
LFKLYTAIVADVLSVAVFEALRVSVAAVTVAGLWYFLKLIRG